MPLFSSAVQFVAHERENLGRSPLGQGAFIWKIFLMCAMHLRFQLASLTFVDYTRYSVLVWDAGTILHRCLVVLLKQRSEGLLFYSSYLPSAFQHVVPLEGTNTI